MFCEIDRTWWKAGFRSHNNKSWRRSWSSAREIASIPVFFCSYHVDYDQTKLSACVREFFFFGGPVEFGMALSSQKSTSKPLRAVLGPSAVPIDEAFEMPRYEIRAI